MSSIPSDIRLINKNLLKNHGKAFNGKVWYRLSWTDNEIEKRVGTFNDFYGEIFLRQFKGMREVRKYEGPQFRERWVLEKLVFIDNPEVWDLLNEGSYEPIWVFRTADGGYQRPIHRSIEFIIGMLNQDREYITKQGFEDVEDVRLDAEILDMYEEFSNRPTLSDHPGIVVPRKYEKMTEVKRSNEHSSVDHAVPVS